MSISEKEELNLDELDVKFHDNFFKDLDKLSSKDIQISTTGVHQGGARISKGYKTSSRPRKIFFQDFY